MSIPRQPEFSGVTAAFVLMGILIISLIIYAVAMYEAFKNSTGPFAPAVLKPPANSCRPLIAVRKLTPEEMARRAALLANAPSKGSPIPCNITPVTIV
jgi:hypothetical protein